MQQLMTPAVLIANASFLLLANPLFIGSKLVKRTQARALGELTVLTASTAGLCVFACANAFAAARQYTVHECPVSKEEIAPDFIAACAHSVCLNGRFWKKQA